MKNKFMFFLGILLVVSLMTSVIAVPKPTLQRPYIRNFAYSESRVVFRPLLSIFVDKETINLGESATFTIDMTTTIPDNDYTDGFFQWQYFGAVWTDKDGNIIDSFEFKRIYGSYSDTFTITPTEIGEYALVGLIIQYDQTYDATTSSWITSPEEILVKDARKLTVIIPTINIYRFENNQCTSKSILSTQRTANDYDTLEECQARIIGPPPTPSIPSIIGQWFVDIWNSFLDWLSGLFGG